MPLTAAQARELAAALDLDLHRTGICLACLLFVSHAIATGDPAEARREIAYFAPDLWEEGLALPAARALERARRQGLRHAEAAIADVQRRGARSNVVRAIVRRLAEQQLAELGVPEQAPVVPLRRRE